MQIVAPEQDPNRACRVLRPICVAGERVEPDAVVILPITTATELATANKVQILGPAASYQNGQAASAKPDDLAPEVAEVAAAVPDQTAGPVTRPPRKTGSAS